jgi:hypothetical protein
MTVNSPHGRILKGICCFFIGVYFSLIQFFIYLRAELNSQWANYRVSSNTSNSNLTAQDKTNKKQQKQRKINPFRLLTLKKEFLKISLSLRTVFTVETHLKASG